MITGSPYHPYRFFLVVLLGVFLSATSACRPASVYDVDHDGRSNEGMHDPGKGRTVVVWMSIDGMRHDYLGRVDTPNFDRLIREGAHTLELDPGFPSLTFPAHTTQATGVKVEKHGVPSNSFYDSERNRHYRFAGFPDLLQAEPIWTTAVRQGVRTAVYDWIKSYNQQQPHAADYFGEGYSGGTTDRERMELILDTWRNDDAKEPLRLIMGYSVTPDKAGHEYGPDAPETDGAVAEMDKLYGWFVEQIIESFESRMSSEDELYLIISTDHGMSPVHHLAHIDRISGVEGRDDVITVTSGNIGHIFLNLVESDEERTRLESEILASLGSYDFARAGRRNELPERWGYNHPTRVGDIVVTLDTGFTFSRRVDADVEPVELHGGPLGMHGYDPETNPDMLGPAIFWRYPEPLGGVYLGRIHSLQLHPTVARILGIEPAEGVTHEPVELENSPPDEPSPQQLR